MPLRDRIRELRRVPASSLRPHPRNWRRHPPHQQRALRELLDEVGLAAAALARELPDGQLELIDGHLRAETLGDQLLPVLVLDVDEADADKLLALCDPLSALAEPDADRLTALVQQVELESAALSTLVEQLASAPYAALWQPPAGDLPAPSGDIATATPSATKQVNPPEPPAGEDVLPASFRLVVECRDEADQQSLFERLGAEGYPCRVLTL